LTCGGRTSAENLGELAPVPMENKVKYILVTIINPEISSVDARSMVKHLWKKC
jgi:hypothetical protein